MRRRRGLTTPQVHAPSDVTRWVFACRADGHSFYQSAFSQSDTIGPTGEFSAGKLPAKLWCQHSQCTPKPECALAVIFRQLASENCVLLKRRPTRAIGHSHPQRLGAKVATEDRSRFRGDMLGRIAACHAHRRNAPRPSWRDANPVCSYRLDCNPRMRSMNLSFLDAGIDVLFAPIGILLPPDRQLKHPCTLSFRQ
ncbi:MAG: hypothetical protein JWP51_2916 [Bradyrhizobium sp.]|nr:hypothetical protein [Bradyrhizobium sp.]